MQNSDGFYNTATGWGALLSNVAGIANTAEGALALLDNDGDINTAVGALALVSNTTGSYNNALGLEALLSNTTGSYNLALGYLAGSALTTGDNNIDIGNSGVAAEAGTIRIGTDGTQTAAYIAGYCFSIRASVITLPHMAISSFSRAANCSGLSPSGSAPTFASCSLNSGNASIFNVSA